MKIYQVDAFTQEPFKGNPAAVCILNEIKDEEWMQAVAQEMNLSETAFLYPEKDGYDLRWFTPAAEVDLCGHATLASAHALWENGYLNLDQQARFYTKSGLLTALVRGDWIELNFPAEPEKETDPPEEIIKAIGAKPIYTGRNRLDYLFEYETEDIIRGLAPDFSFLGSILGYRGVIVTSKSKLESYDFVSRYFAPGVGINEDPVTGSAHCCLGPFWKQKLGKNPLTGLQVSRRTGVVKVSVEGERVLLMGRAVTVLKGELTA
ncbi:MAG: PhzF family phenazine biosynthesis protein [Clostridia bacterium]|jgi:PhzF family phenazine biosynthesis protein|nr:PhzF family phenazine biosynthesis protein [Clostridia bacterium]